MDPRTTDVLIAGGGPVGAALARMLHARGVQVALVSPAAAGEAHGRLRPIALSAPSRDLLRRIGLANDVDFTPIRTIHVSQAGGFGRTRMTADEHDRDALGWVCDLAGLARSMARDVAPLAADGTVIGWSAEPASSGVRVEAERADGVIDTWRARLLVVADGGASADRTQVTAYDQTAIAAMVRTEAAHGGVAWERFTVEGPLALLPFDDRYALVWSMRNERAALLMRADDATFLDALGAAFGRRLGRFTAVEGRVSYPLSLRRSVEPPTAGVVRIGNASQTLHPVAGQGLNLGLRDASVLAMQIAQTTTEALGDVAFAERFARERAVDRIGAIGATDFLARVFAIDAAPLRMLRGAGLALLDVVPPARRLLARRMMLGLR